MLRNWNAGRPWSTIPRFLIALFVPMALLVSTAIIYFTGGTEGQFHALAHLYYIPIVVAAISFGPVAGVLTGLAATLLGGPNMPANVVAQLMQPASDWLTRAFFFLWVGGTVGVLTGRLRSALQAERRRRKQLELSQFRHETLAAFTEAISQRDWYTGGHVDRMREHATDVARRLGLSPDQVDAIGYAAQLHDIGKVAIPTDILRKPGSLSRQEWKIIQEHPVIGSQILERVSFLQEVVPLVRHHHEHYDGSGYPDGCVGRRFRWGLE